MSFSDVHPGDPINAINVQQLIDALKGTAGKGVPLTVSAVNDAARYALTLENTEATNSRALNVLKNDGSVLIRADATGVTLGQPLNLPTGSVTSGAILDGTIATADLANQAVTNQKLGTDTARLNLLTNGGFEIWQRGNGPFTANQTYSADRWMIALIGSDTLSVSRDTVNVDTGSAAAAACTFTLGTGAGATNVVNSSPIGEYPGFRGRTLTLSMRVRTSAANAVRVGLNNFYASTAHWIYSPFHTGDGTWQTLTATNTCDPTATFFQPTVLFAASCTAYLDNAMLVVGSVPADYAPLHPADDLARCLRYYEAPSETWFANGVNMSTTSAEHLYVYRTTKAVTPTVTFAAPATFSVRHSLGTQAATAISTVGIGLSRSLLQTTVASGLTQGQASTLQQSAAGVFVEANP